VAVPQQLVIDRIRAQCEELEERYEGYRRDLVTYLAEVLSYERAGNQQTAKQVEKQLDAFGDLFHRQTSESAASRPDATPGAAPDVEDGGGRQ
jgi:hypothetical protein